MTEEEGGWYNDYWISEMPSILSDPSSLPQYNLCAHGFEQKVVKPTTKTSLKATPLRNIVKVKHLLLFLAKPAYV